MAYNLTFNNEVYEEIWTDLTVRHLNNTTHERMGILINIYLCIYIKYNNKFKTF